MKFIHNDYKGKEQNVNSSYLSVVRLEGTFLHSLLFYLEIFSGMLMYFTKDNNWYITLLIIRQLLN